MLHTIHRIRILSSKNERKIYALPKCGLNRDDINLTLLAQRRRALVTACVAIIPLFSYLLMFPLASEAIRHDLGFTYTQVGTLIAVVTLFFALGGPPAGWLSDRWRPKYAALIGLLAPLITSVLFTASSSFYSLLVAQILVGIGLGFYWTGSIALLSTLYPRESLSRAVGPLNAGAGLGLLALTLYAPWCITEFGWRRTYAYLAIPILFAFVGFLAFASPEPGTNVRSRSSNPPQAYSAVPIGPGGVLLIMLIGFLGQGQYITVLTLQVPYTLSHKVTLQNAGLMSTLGMIAVVVAPYVGGWLAEKKNKTIAIVRWSFLLALVTFPLGYVTSWTGILAVYLMAVWPVMFGLPAYFGTVSRIASRESIGRYTGLLTMATAVGSTVYSQTNGIILNALGPVGYRAIFWYAGLSGLLAFLVTFHPVVARIDE
jgi:predicted MFS family arabinose efflux permease